MSKPRIININFYRPESAITKERWPQVRIGRHEKPWRLFLSGGNLELGFRNFATQDEALTWLAKHLAYHTPRKAA